MSLLIVYLWFIGVALVGLSAILAIVYRNPELTKEQIDLVKVFVTTQLSNFS